MLKTKDLLKNPKIRLIAAALILILLSLNFFKYARTLWKQNNEFSTEIKRYRDDIARSSSAPSKQELLNAQIKKMDAEIAVIKNNFFLDTEEIFSSLNHFTQELKISLRSITPGEKEHIDIPNNKDIFIEFLPLNIKLSCDFHQLLEFLKKIEGFEKTITVDSIKIQANPQNIWSHSIEIELKAPLLIYVKTNG